MPFIVAVADACICYTKLISSHALQLILLWYASKVFFGSFFSIFASVCYAFTVKLSRVVTLGSLHEENVPFPRGNAVHGGHVPNNGASMSVRVFEPPVAGAWTCCNKKLSALPIKVCRYASFASYMASCTRTLCSGQ